MLRKTYTCSELCSHLNISIYDLNGIVREGKLKACNHRYSLIEKDDRGYLYRGAGEEYVLSTGPLTVNDENGFYFLTSDVEDFVRENPITPHILPSDPAQKALAEKPVVDPTQENIDKDKIIPPQSPKPANFFTKTGAYWEVSYKGEKKMIQDLDGIHYIAILLERPGTPVSCIDLYQDVSGKAPAKIMTKGVSIGERLHTDHKKQAVNTPKAKAEYYRKYTKLEDDLLKINDLPDDERTPEDEIVKKEIEDEMAAIKSYLKEKTFVDPNDKKAQVNITKRLQSAYKAIGKAGMKELAKHLQDHIKPDGAFGLCYIGSITWEITIKK